MQEDRPILIAGPCVIEGEETMGFIGQWLKSEAALFNFDFYFKASFAKENRTSPLSFRGPGIVKGISMFEKIKNMLNVKITTDVHSVDNVGMLYDATKSVDMLQIPAMLSRQTTLLEEASSTGLAVNIKKMLTMSVGQLITARNKIDLKRNVMVTHRGTFAGHGCHPYIDMSEIAELKRKSYAKVIVDISHSFQVGMFHGSGGSVQYGFNVGLAAIAAGADGLFMEVHHNPDEAMCDGPTTYKIDGALQEFFHKVNEVYNLTRGYYGV